MKSDTDLFQALATGNGAKLTDEERARLRVLLRQQNVITSSSKETDFFDGVEVLKSLGVFESLRAIQSAVLKHYKNDKHAKDCDAFTIKFDRDGMKVCHIVPLYDKDKDGKPVNTKLSIDTLGKGIPAVAFKF